VSPSVSPSVTPTPSVSPSPTPNPGSGSSFGWAIISLNLFDQLNGNSTASSSSPYTYVNGYPTINGTYYDCNGNIDNDAAHHSPDMNDMDPGHHVGQNCPNGVAAPNGNIHSFTNRMINFLFNGTGQLTQWVIVPLNSDLIHKLATMIGM
jgi:hypothetical protein